MIVAKFMHRLLLVVRELMLPINLLIRKFSRTDPNKIAFFTITSKYTCNPKYISEKIRELYPNIKIVWLTSRKKEVRETFPNDVLAVPARSLRGMIEAYSAKVWVDNGLAFTADFKRKDDQIHIQTMHGSLGIKRLDNGILVRQRHYIGRREIWRESNLTDYVITNSRFEEDVFRSVFWKNVPMKRMGHARTDILFSDDEKMIGEIRDRLFRTYGIPKEDRLVLYAPTHRKDFVVDLDYGMMKSALDERFGGNFSVLLKLHPKTVSEKLEKTSFAYDLTEYPDIQELMIVADVGITDYSSWIFDYILAKRPGFIYAPDLLKYNTITKFCYPLEETPFPIGRNNEELAQCIREFDEQTYLGRVDSFLKEKECVDDGRSAERIAKWIAGLMNRDNPVV